MKQKRFIHVLINNYLAFRIKLVEVPKRYHSQLGEVDIFIDAAKNKYFEKSVLCTPQGFQLSDNPINNISWHGFYALKNDQIKFPVINFKSDKAKVSTYRHTGTINQNDVFLFPICSLYIPSYFSNNNHSSFNKENSNIIYLESFMHSRIDFFVLPKIISLDRFFNDFMLSIFYFSADITIFNKYLNCELNNLPIKSNENMKLINFNLNGWDVLMRVLYTNETREPALIGTYSILFHDPFDSINTLLNRELVYQDINNPSKLERTTVSARHKDDLDKYFGK